MSEESLYRIKYICNDRSKLENLARDFSKISGVDWIIRSGAVFTADIFTESQAESIYEKLSFMEEAGEFRPIPESEDDIFSFEKSATPRCPKCGSASIQAMKKGFGLSKAAAGALIFGPVGLLAGAVGSNDVVRVCLNCKAKF